MSVISSGIVTNLGLFPYVSSFRNRELDLIQSCLLLADSKP